RRRGQAGPAGRRVPLRRHRLGGDRRAGDEAGRARGDILGGLRRRQGERAAGGGAGGEAFRHRTLRADDLAARPDRPAAAPGGDARCAALAALGRGVAPARRACRTRHAGGPDGRGRRRGARRLSPARRGALRLGVPGRADGIGAARAADGLFAAPARGGGEPADRGLARAQPALERRPDARRAQSPFDLVRARFIAPGRHFRRPGGERAAPGAVFRADELAARQSARALGPDGHGRLGRGARAVSRPSPGGVRLVASGRAAGARHVDQVDPAPRAFAPGAAARAQPAEGRMAARRHAARRIPRAGARPSHRARVADARLLRTQGPRSRARRARQGTQGKRRAPVDAPEPGNLAPDAVGRARLNRKLAWKLNRLRRMSPAEVAYRVSRAIQARAERARLARNGAATPAADLGLRPAPWIHADAMVEAQPYLAAADRIVQGKLDLFALRGVDLGSPPRWNRDPKTGIEAPLEFGKLLDYRDADVARDIKYLWEPNRHLHLVTLAQAHALSSRKVYLETLQEHLDSWFLACPYGWGPNWS